MRTRTESKPFCAFSTDKPYKYYANSMPIKNAPKAVLKVELYIKKNNAFNKMKEY